MLLLREGFRQLSSPVLKRSFSCPGQFLTQVIQVTDMLLLKMQLFFKSKVTLDFQKSPWSCSRGRFTTFTTLLRGLKPHSSLRSRSPSTLKLMRSTRDKSKLTQAPLWGAFLLFKYIFDGNEIHRVIGVFHASINLSQALSQLALWAKKRERKIRGPKSSKMFFPIFFPLPLN